LFDEFHGALALMLEDDGLEKEIAIPTLRALTLREPLIIYVC
jgi:hypothetical protein